MKRLCLFVFLLCMSFQAQALSIIGDEETESYLFDILTPIFRAAQLPLSRDYIHIVKDDSLNAFVGDHNHMFVHTGTLIKASNTNELEGVLAHETGHILGGHILRLKIKMKDLQKISLASMVAAAGAAVASGRGDAAIAVVLGTQSAAINALTSYQVSEERAADETAVLLLGQNHKSVSGIKNFMTKIQQTNRLQGVEESPYFRTHPITAERVSFFDEKLKKEKNVVSNKAQDERLKRIQAKLIAYLEPLDRVLSRFPLDDRSVYGNIAHSVYYMRQKDVIKALKYTDELINQEPDNPFFYELKAQALFESGRTKEAANIYKKAVDLFPYSDLLKLSYVEAVLANNPSQTEMELLIPSLDHICRHANHPEAYLYLGQIYARTEKMGIADYYAAEYNYAIGETARAQKMLNKALKTSLRSDIKLRALDLKNKMEQDRRQEALF